MIYIILSNIKYQLIACKKYLVFLKHFHLFKRKQVDDRFRLNFKDRYPCIFDAVESTSFDSHYLYHTSWAARIIHNNQPDFHVDIGSCLRFISIVSAFVAVKFYDFRPPKLLLSNLECKHADILHLPFNDDSLNSLSCMHVLEHIGLGRYGDPLEPEGDLLGAKELERVLAVGGTLLMVLPVSGDPHIEFNAHRIYSFEMVLDLFPGLKLQELSLIPDDAGIRGIIENARPELINAQKYGCGCFCFTKE